MKRDEIDIQSYYDYVNVQLAVAFLILAATILILFRFFKKESPNQAIFLNIYNNTVNNLKNDSFIPWTASKSNGATNGLFSFLTREISDTSLKKDLNSAKDGKDAKQIVISYFKNSPNLWNKRNNPYHFSNHFLCQLNRHDIKLYWEILEEGRGIKVVKSSKILYRRDNRGPEIIFKEGFKLKDSANYAGNPKYQGTTPVTYDCGVSTSDKIPPIGYGNYCYTIKIPAKHTFIIIDIVNSPKNKGKLTKYQIGLREFNVLNDIPSHYIQKCTHNDKAAWFGIFNSDKKTNNPNFDASKTRSHKPRGCHM